MAGERTFNDHQGILGEIGVAGATDS